MQRRTRWIAAAGLAVAMAGGIAAAAGGEVNLDKSFKVVATEPDEDHPGEAERR